MAVKACVKSTRHRSSVKHLLVKELMKEGGSDWGFGKTLVLPSIGLDLIYSPATCAKEVFFLSFESTGLVEDVLGSEMFIVVFAMKGFDCARTFCVYAARREIA